MADASAARPQAVFEFKSATLPLIAVILKTADLGVLAQALDAQLADSPDFFNSPVNGLSPEGAVVSPVMERITNYIDGNQHDPAERKTYALRLIARAFQGRAEKFCLA